MPAFQLYEDQFSDGAFGINAFGTSSFGGPRKEPVTIELNWPSDELSEDGQEIIGEVVHRRFGMVVGARSYATARTWTCTMQGLRREQLEELRVFWRARTFLLLQDQDENGRQVNVYWPGDFQPTNQRGGYYDIQFPLEEIIR